MNRHALGDGTLRQAKLISLVGVQPTAVGPFDRLLEQRELLVLLELQVERSRRLRLQVCNFVQPTINTRPAVPRARCGTRSFGGGFGLWCTGLHKPFTSSDSSQRITHEADHP